MEEMTVKLKWDDKKLGRGWMNIDNLEACLFGKEHTERELLEVIFVRHVLYEEVKPNGKENNHQPKGTKRIRRRRI